jgi:hypothetical protein
MYKFIITLFLFAYSTHAFSQQKATPTPLKVGLFTSLYLDSAFKQSKYRFNKQMPKYILKGLDFALGASMAIDSIDSIAGAPIEFALFDIRSGAQSIRELAKKNVFDSLNLIIADVSGNDFKLLAEYTCEKRIPFISVTYPNDAGVTNCPATIIINPTLQIHCEKIYQFLLEENVLANRIFISKKGNQETRIKSYFDKLNVTADKKKMIDWKNLDLTDSISPALIENYLDSTQHNVIVAGSLDEKFALKLLDNIVKLKGYEISVIGMPSWETITDLNAKKYTELPVYFTTSFYKKNTPLLKQFEQSFITRTNGKPSDIAFKAFEATLVFSDLLITYGADFLQSLSLMKEPAFTPYRLKPVYHQSTTPSYLENKHVYLLKKSGETINEVNAE